MISINVNCPPDEKAAISIRSLFCRESYNPKNPDRNPLLETKFNEYLSEIAQEAFNEGRKFQKQHPDL